MMETYFSSLLAKSLPLQTFLELYLKEAIKSSLQKAASN